MMHGRNNIKYQENWQCPEKCHISVFLIAHSVANKLMLNMFHKNRRLMYPYFFLSSFLLSLTSSAYSLCHWVTLNDVQSLAKSPPAEGSARRRKLYLTTHNTHKRQPPMAPVGILTRNPSKQAATDLRLKPRDHRDRPYTSDIIINYQKKRRLCASR
jgi:hypothetical protein